MSMGTKIKWWSCWQIDAAAVGFCLLATAGVFFGAARPMVLRHRQLHEQQADLANQRRKVSQLSASAAELEQRLSEVRRQLAQSKVTLRPTSQVNRQIAKLTELFNACQLKANDIQLGQAEHSSKYTVVPIKISGTGRFPSCVRFLHELAEKFPDTGVASFEISGDPAQPAEPGAFRFELYWYASATRVTSAQQ